MYEAHELANIFPLIEGDEFDKLVDDIKTNGLLNPIVLYEGKILDGRNRFNACLEAGIQPLFVEYDGDEPDAYVIALNVRRRHLKQQQIDQYLVEFQDWRRGRPNSDHGLNFNQQQFAKKNNTTTKSLHRATTIKNKGDDAVIAGVKDGSISQRSAVDIVTLSKEQQQEIVAKGEDEIIKMATKIRAERSAKSKEQLLAKKREAMKIPPPKGKYKTIVIDPPWEMQRIQMEDRTFSNDVFDYPTMSIDEIKNMKLPAHEECHLWLWTTQKYLPKCFDILNAWDFKYLVTFVWHKNGGFQPVGLPQYNCEFVLLARKGGQGFLDTKQFFTCFNAPRREHSRKPDEFYDLVKRVSPEPRIDYFARESREGYETFGYEEDEFNE
jgi:N6-adenosine-specific RNA methylase IME4